MLRLNVEAMEYAIDMCYKQRGYRVIVGVHNQNEIDRILYEVTRTYHQRSVHHEIDRNGIYFHNGSFIRFISAHTMPNGHRCDLFICSEHVGYTTAMEWFHRVENYDWLFPNERIRYGYEDQTVITMKPEAEAVIREFFNRDNVVPTVPETPDVSQDDLMKILGL